MPQEVVPGTLDLMVLKTLDATGPQHGYGLARRIEQISDDLLQLNQGTIYASIQRLLERGWIRGAWGTSEHNRRAKFYSLTPSGRRELLTEADSWQKTVDVMARLLRLGSAR